MEHSRTKYPLSDRSPRDLAELVRKLRWVGMAEEARRLELAVNALPPEERACVLSEPFSTD